MQILQVRVQEALGKTASYRIGVAGKPQTHATCRVQPNAASFARRHRMNADRALS